MITFFTTTKKFEGKIRSIQLNAIRSWLYLHKDIEVLVFDETDEINLKEIDNRITIIKDFEKDFEIPRVDSMFIKASTIAKNKLVCFVNCDIILTHEFLIMCSVYLNKLESPTGVYTVANIKATQGIISGGVAAGSRDHRGARRDARRGDAGDRDA